MSSEEIVHVIDDDDAVRESVAFLLRSADLKVRSYESAAAFLDAIAVGVSGCVITDVRMPGMSGIDLLPATHSRCLGILGTTGSTILRSLPCCSSQGATGMAPAAVNSTGME